MLYTSSDARRYDFSVLVEALEKLPANVSLEAEKEIITYLGGKLEVWDAMDRQLKTLYLIALFGAAI